MTREEIIQLVRDEVARALVRAAEAVIEMNYEPRRDRPARLSGADSSVQEVAREIAGRLPESVDAAGLSELERHAMERFARLRAKPPREKKPRQKRNPTP